MTRHKGILQENSALPFVGMLASLALFPSERASFLHDWASPGRYSPTVFLTSYTIQEIPLQVGAALLYTLLVEFVIVRCQWPFVFSYKLLTLIMCRSKTTMKIISSSSLLAFLPCSTTENPLASYSVLGSKVQL